MSINIWAVLVCAVAAQVLGMIWYGKGMFGNKWGMIIGMDTGTMTPERMAEMKKKMMPMAILQFVLSIITAGVLASVMNSYLVLGVGDGIKTSLLMWLGFVVPLSAGVAMWSGKPKKLAQSMFLITVSYQLVLFVIFGLVLGSWR